MYSVYTVLCVYFECICVPKMLYSDTYFTFSLLLISFLSPFYCPFPLLSSLLLSSGKILEPVVDFISCAICYTKNIVVVRVALEVGKERPEGWEPRPTDIPVGYVTRDIHYNT